MTPPTFSRRFFNRRARVAAAVLLSLGAALAGCSSESVTPPPSGSGELGRLAYSARVANQPSLFVRWLNDSSPTHLHVANVADHVAGNYTDLVVDDAHLLALGSPIWSPDVSRIAIVATVAYDQSEIVVMRADGSAAEVASPNTQIIASEPQWSPNGNQLAYTMSTLPGFQGIDLFVTDLTTHAVRRLTTGARIVNAAVRWSSDGSAIYYARTTGSATTGPDNWTSEVVRVNVATGAAQTIASGIVGQISAISETGGRVLLTRNVGTTRALFEAMLGASERQLVAADVAYARYVAPSDKRVLVATATGSDARAFDVFDFANDKRVTLANIAADAAADVAYVVALAVD